MMAEMKLLRRAVRVEVYITMLAVGKQLRRRAHRLTNGGRTIIAAKQASVTVHGGRQGAEATTLLP